MTPRRAQSPNALQPTRPWTREEWITLAALLAVLGLLILIGGTR